MEEIRKLLEARLAALPDLEVRPSKVAGGAAVFFKDKEIAHFHSDNEIDVRLTKKVIRSEKLTHPCDSLVHPNRSPGSQWIELRFNRTEDIEEVVRLFKLAVEQY